MAMTASISLAQSTATVNQDILATLTVSNSGGSAVNVTSINPTIVQTSGGAGILSAASACDQNSLAQAGPLTSVSVAAAGSTLFQFTVKAFAPSTNGSTYSVGAIITSDDGSVFSPTAATVTVNRPS